VRVIALRGLNHCAMGDAIDQGAVIHRATQAPTTIPEFFEMEERSGDAGAVAATTEHACQGAARAGSKRWAVVHSHVQTRSVIMTNIRHNNATQQSISLDVSLRDARTWSAIG